VLGNARDVENLAECGARTAVAVRGYSS
jgi:hypothetical protein